MEHFRIDPSSPVPDLLARFTVKRGFLRRDRVEAPVYSLQQQGCVIKSDEMFNPGDNVHLDLVLDMPFENIEASSLLGHVTEVRKYCSNFFYTIEFHEFSSDKTVSDRISRLTNVIKRKRALRRRRNGKSQADSIESLPGGQAFTSSGF
ncbi:hypothetical protein [Mangrovitalea sediminis]|uniref:hypothetical protein n=1 Tax=Mangrovitalea sediminis TaxID=1982043 RepID=UPI000BE50A61|nr:hypothetical protein [Mangrovitalea sediminis]